MNEESTRLSSLISEARSGALTRRQVVQRGIALGMSVGAIGAALGSMAPRVAAQDATPEGATPAAAGTNMVGIVNKEMTQEEIVAAIQAEGQVNVGNWTYTANDTLIAKFTEYVKTTYGVDVKLNYEASQAPSTYITNLYTALQSGSAPSYDVMAIEENYWAEAMSQPESVVAEFLPSALVPNADRVIDLLKHAPTAVGFQASATPGICYDKARAPWITDWTDLGDERLKQRLTMPIPGDITCGGMMMGVAAAMGLDYKVPEEMTQAIDFLIQKVHPNVLQYTTDSATMQQLLRAGLVDAVGFWDSLPRMEFLNGQTDSAFLIAKSGQYLANGYMWIPKGAPHPILAQIFINWRISDEAQFPPDSWGLEHGPWAELNEGIIGESYESLIPEWFAENYFDFYPTIQQLTDNYRLVDWDYYAENAPEWMDYYAKGIGQ